LFEPWEDVENHRGLSVITLCRRFAAADILCVPASFFPAFSGIATRVAAWMATFDREYDKKFVEGSTAAWRKPR
jgi:hypothetical protein